MLEHRLFAIEKQRRHLVKTLRCEEVPPDFWTRAGIQQTAGLPLFIATSQFTRHASLQQAIERKVDGGGNVKFQQAIMFAIESTTGKPPVDKKNPLQNLSALQLAKVTTGDSELNRALLTKSGKVSGEYDQPRGKASGEKGEPAGGPNPAKGGL